MASNFDQLSAIIQNLQNPQQGADPFAGAYSSQPPASFDQQQQLDAPPRITPRRSVGNVLADLFSGSRLAQSMRDPGIAAWSDLLGNIPRALHGQDPQFLHTQYAQQLQDRDRQDQARNAFAQIFQNANPQLQQLAQYDPETAFTIAQGLQKQQQEAQKPLLVGNTVIPRTVTGGYDIPGAKTFTQPFSEATFGDQPGVINKITGQVTPVGMPKTKAPVYQKDANGTLWQMDPTTGQPLRQIGPSVKTDTKAATSKTDPSNALSLLDNIQSGFDDLKNLGALPGQGNAVQQAAGALGRSGVGQAVGEQFGNSAAQKRLELNKNISQLQQEMVKSLPASAVRTAFEQKILRQSLPDPTKMDYGTAKTVIGQLRQSYSKAVSDAAAEVQGAKPTVSTPPREAVNTLRANPTPQMRAHFDDVFGSGASARILGQ